MDGTRRPLKGRTVGREGQWIDGERARPDKIASGSFTNQKQITVERFDPTSDLLR